ncbi:MAG: hypothetical protein P1U80_02545 [Pseudomonadales bacterium]|nr:hypothetical protein [Pseudomonadales bacterium]
MTSPCTSTYYWARQARALLCLVLALFVPQTWGLDYITPQLQESAIDQNTLQETNNSTQKLQQAFGIALYEFQQGNYFQALVEISAANLRHPVNPSDANTSQQAMKTLEAGIMLSYGMQNHARDLISNVATKTLGGPQQDLAWFYLAQLYTNKQDWPQAYQTMQKIGDQLPPTLHKKLDQLKANIYINNGQIAEAQQLLKKNQDPVLGAYTSFNLAAAEQKKQNGNAALSHLNNIIGLPGTQLDVRLLKDRAHLAAAQLYASEQNYPQAFEHFNQIKIDSPYSSEALFGQGWAAYHTDKPSQALASWNLLQTNYAFHPQSQKTQIAIPFVYLSMDYPDTALQKYRQAVTYYDELMTQLEGAKANTHNQHMFGFMNKFRTGEVTDWHLEPVEFPVTPETALVGNLLEQQNIHEELTALAELYQLSYAVKKRRNDLISFSYLIENNDRNHKEKAPLISAEAKKLQRSNALIQAKNLRKQITKIRSDHSVFSLMNTDERDYAKRIQRSTETLSLIDDVDKKNGYERRIKRVDGILLWNLTEAYSERIWNAQKGLKAIEKSIASSQKIQGKLEAILTQHLTKSGPITDKVALFEQQLQQTADKTKYLIEQQEQKIQTMFMLALNQKQEEIRNYLVHSHLAIARLTDKPKPIASSSSISDTIDDKNSAEPPTSGEFNPVTSATSTELSPMSGASSTKGSLP